MGGNSSKPEQEAGEVGETTFFATRDSPVQFSESLISHLSAQSVLSPDGSSPNPERQSTLDSHIKSRIQLELERLRSEEANVREQIESALEKENLDREMGSDQSGVTHSVSLLQDLEELGQRMEHAKAQSLQLKEAAPWNIVEQNKVALQECLTRNLETPLNCQSKVLEFLSAVAGVEKAFVASI